MKTRLRRLTSAGIFAGFIASSGAAHAGRAEVDLSDAWTPYLFSDLVDAEGQPAVSRYRAVYLGLANDLGDPDGQPLPEGAHNYLELYGIPPSLSVIRARFVEDQDPKRCADVDYEKLRAVETVPSRESKKRDEAQLHREVFAEVEKRLACEGFFPPKAKHTRGKLDDGFRDALKRFQHKNMLYDAAALRSATMDALAKTPLENDYAALVRTLTERVVAAADILEDGSASAERNLVEPAVKAALEQLHLTTLEDAKKFFEAHSAQDLKTLKLPVEFPAPPEYYSAHMDLSVVVDRGDVFYDPPWDEEFKEHAQNRKKFPMFYLRVTHNGKVTTLVRWRTTIGGWRSDLAPNGYEYFRYKGSDIGPRVWRNVVAGPVWIAPNSTPVRTLIKGKVVRGSHQSVVNYDEVGPGYLSAYGLVAAYNVVPGKDGKPDWDNGVRVHGSSEVLSIRNPDAYSHGCHRLMNHLAVRLFSWLLKHRTVIIEGDKPLNFSRQFLVRDDVYEMRLPSRGFWFRLEPTVPVNVLEGNIIGERRKPMRTYIKKPKVEYPPGPIPTPADMPESRAGGGGGE